MLGGRRPAVRPSLRAHCGPVKSLPKCCSAASHLTLKGAAGGGLPLASVSEGEGVEVASLWGRVQGLEGLCDLAALPFSTTVSAFPMWVTRGLEGAEMDLGSLATLRE